MRSFRFLLSRRWALFTLAVAILAYGTWWLGEWQWGRLQDKHHGNAIISANLKQAPQPVEEVMAPGKKVDSDTEWKRVVVTGTYDAADTITWRYRTNDHSESGIDVVVPLITADGTGVLVDRGWLASTDQDNHPVPIPPPPSGQVTVVGWVRADATGSSTRVSQLGTRAISSRTIAPAIGRTLDSGFLIVQSESPKPATALSPNDEPDLSNGPHFFYALQWWFLGILAVVGFFYLMYDERRLYVRGPEPATEPDPDVTGGDDEDAVDAHAGTPTGPPVSVAAARGTVVDERKARRHDKNARRQALAAAYAAARARDEANRTKAFGQSIERSGSGSQSRES
ncbi:SURF1 family protein [Nocardioides sp. BP30]|uniref:SURF1 family cytochrome oxidase biogenesis protein n=1 Tax=Nocardioides sp. BP30 TaxID=3036374 RepID=UPI0024687F2F|nr:SURF1 family protein [Nocardioides sp. BP30]WGL50872.1 SURF1 family protein [Nocardioides sp. BP30]